MNLSKVLNHDFSEVNMEIGFSSQETQYLTYNIIQSIRYTREKNKFLEEFVDIYEGQSVIAVLEKYGKIIQVYPLHELETLNILKSIWVKQIWTWQPLGMYLCVNKREVFLIEMYINKKPIFVKVGWKYEGGLLVCERRSNCCATYILVWSMVSLTQISYATH